MAKGTVIKTLKNAKVKSIKQRKNRKKTAGSFGQPKGPSPYLTIEKRKKKRKTILKEAIGLNNWEALQNYLLTHGSAKMMKELKKLNGRNFAICFESLLEYVKPKLARTELTGKNGEAIKIQGDPFQNIRENSGIKTDEK